MKIRSIIALVALLMTLPLQARVADDSTNVQSVVDEVIWVVGDEAILKSDVEAMRIQGQQEGMRWKGDPDCSILRADCRPETLFTSRLLSIV